MNKLKQVNTMVNKTKKTRTKKTTILNFDNYKEGAIEYVYYLIGEWQMTNRQASEILLRAAAYNYVEFYLQKYRKEGKGIKEFLHEFGVGVEVELAQVYLELARAVADGNYKMRALDKIILPAERILPTIYTLLTVRIEELRKEIQKGYPCYEGVEI